MNRWGSGLLLVATLACTERTPPVFGQGQAGDACGQISDCAAGLECKSSVCAPLPRDPSQRGAACTAATDCGAGLCCGNQGVCRPVEGDFGIGQCGRPAGDSCAFPSDCDVGLLCTSAGRCELPGAPGTRGLGERCAALADCQRPLVCGLEDTCVKLPLYGGVSCARSEDERGAFRMHFEIPRDPATEEFFRHPFPSDVRRGPDGRLNLAGFPGPGEVLGVDFTGRFVRAAQEDLDGFGLTGPIFLRFSDAVDPRTLTVAGATAALSLVALTQGSPDFGRPVPLQLDAEDARTPLICAHHVAVAPVDGRPLEPKTTYGLLVRRTIKSTLGDVPIQDAEFQVMLAAAPPSDPASLRAHQAFAPLRAYLQSQSIDPASLAGATVFTTGDPAAIAGRLRRAVRAAPAPVVTAVVRCDAGVRSPCAAAVDDRGCAPAAATHFELQGKVRLPVFQGGTRPYPEPGPSGNEGAFVLGADGVPTVQGTEEVCFGLTVPRGAMPAGGWPVLIYGHGTGGSFVSGLRSFGASMAQVRADGGGTLAQVAVLTFDNVMHGPRQGLPEAAWQDPGDLFFNLRNPRAARDNVLQGAADVMSLVRLVETTTLAAAQTGLAGPVRFDRRRVIYYGHSQGTTIIPAALAAEAGLRAAVLTGAGGELGLSVLEKRKPTDVASLARVAFADNNLTRLHPAIGLISMFFSPADSIPFAPRFRQGVPRGEGGLELLQIYGLRDGYTPESTQAALIRASGQPLVGSILKPLAGVGAVPTRPPPSYGAAQFQPAAGETYDGHFVGERDAVARRLIEVFVGTAATAARAEIRR